MIYLIHVRIYLYAYYINQPFLYGWFKTNSSPEQKKHLNQHSPRRQLSGLYIPWIYSGGLTLGVAKNLSKMTAPCRPQKTHSKWCEITPIGGFCSPQLYSFIFSPFLKKSMVHLIYNYRGHLVWPFNLFLKENLPNPKSSPDSFVWGGWHLDKLIPPHTRQVTLSWSFICPHHPLP